jgi:hypothetical protein
MRVMARYRLELRWDSVEYNTDDTAVLKGAYFCGSVFKDAAKLRGKDELILDMTAQHQVFISDYYHATLYWGGVEYLEDKVLLKDACIIGKYVNSIETLENTDWVLIDCKEHEEKKHPFSLVYYAEVRKRDGENKY